MFIMCQNCHRIYDVPSRLLSDSRQTFRCQACGFVWTGATQSDHACDEEVIDRTPMAPSLPEMPTAAADVLDETVREEVRDDADADALPPIEDKEERPDFKINDSEPDNILETPLPEADAFTPVDAEKKEISFGGRLMVAAMGVLIITAAITLGLGRFYLARRFPVMRQMYQAIGIDAVVAGEGLDFKDTVFDVISEQNVPTMLIRGNVMNTGTESRDVPFIHFILFDGADEPVQEQTIVPIKEKIEPGEALPFETKIKPVRATVRRVDITFKKGLAP